MRPLQNGTFRSLRLSAQISASGSNFNPRNIQYIPAVKIFAFLELEQISADFENYHFSKVSNLWSRRAESNRLPADYESAALPTELRRLKL